MLVGFIFRKRPMLILKKKNKNVLNPNKLSNISKWFKYINSF